MKNVKSLIPMLLVLLSSYMLPVHADHLRDHILVSAKIDGSQEVPAVSTTALGVASFMINPTRDTICVNITYTGLSGAATGIHIHEGDPGTNGPVVKDLSSFITNNNISTILTGADASAANISKLLMGKFYINIHTAANPGGEIRGQLKLETDWSFHVMLNGMQEVPPVATTAYGVGYFNLSLDLSKIDFHIVTNGLSGAITGAHLHYGGIGQNGGVAVDISSSVSGNVLTGTIPSPSMALVDSLKKSRVYVNLHTSANPGGEIRSQLIYSSRYLYFDASLDGMQEVPPVATTAKGSGTVKITTMMDTLYYDIAATGLSGTITGAHFHDGALGANGPVALDISSGIMGNRIVGFITGSSLTPALINKFLRANIYINLHTAANPGGEIRGQVYRVMREGYSAYLNGMQEVPPVTTTALGTAIVSIDRGQSNAHYMTVVNGLTPTGAHFHKAKAGQNGGVVFDISSMFMNNGAFGYWNASSSPAFVTANSVQFRNDSIYLNIHTTMHPSGEIRGQVYRGFKCAALTTSVEENFGQELPENVSIYPNPTRELLYINLSQHQNTNTQIAVFDVMGKQIYTSTGHHHVVDLSKSPTGMYLVRVQIDNKFFMRKIIKE